jgi:hypothetical protein
VLGEHGYSAAQIAEFVARGVVGPPPMVNKKAS